MTNRSEYVPDDFERVDASAVSTRAIAEHYGVCTRTITRWRDATGRHRDRAPLLTAVELVQARQMLEEGCPLSEVAATLGRSYTAILRRFHEYAGRWTGAEVRQIREGLERIPGHVA